MKDEILDLSIKCLQRDGLRFSVDALAQELKISKKTVYKYFQSKEDLAFSIYEKFYNDQEKKLENILINAADNSFYESLLLLYESHYMVREEVFNKYALNNSVKTFALTCHNKLWEKIKTFFTSLQLETTEIIIFGTFEKLSKSAVKPIKVIEKLVKVIC